MKGFSSCIRNEREHLKSLSSVSLFKNYHLKYVLVWEVVKLWCLWGGYKYFHSFESTPRTFWHVSLQYHCSTESQPPKLDLEKLQWSRDNRIGTVPVNAALESEVIYIEVYFGQSGLQLENAIILIWIKAIFLNFMWVELWWGFFPPN